MIYLDTNVLVRVITGDDPLLANRAITTIQSGGQNDFGMLDAILVEVCFVLEFHDYKMARADIADALEILAAIPQILASKTTLSALKLYRRHPKLDYADCLLVSTGGKDGVFTFDKDLQKLLQSAR